MAKNRNPLSAVFAGNLGGGRRSHRRYLVDLVICCRALPGGRPVVGRTYDISSGGVRFTSSEILDPGTKVELAIDWPVLLDGASPLQLIGWGNVLRTGKHGTAIKIERHEFWTRGTRTVPPPVGGFGGSFEQRKRD
ncbi:MAG TPA: PilZ domain-containing protein [Bryobacteraceae bacterium]|nr:PilZ domain-containing protein [Bryobacteraceae bacterium]